MSLPVAASPRLSDIDWRWALPRIAVLFVVTRLLVLVVAGAVEATQPASLADAGLDMRPFITSLTVWDGGWFTSIAENGYHAEPFYTNSNGAPYVDYAFYPLYPAVVRAATLVTGGDAPVAGVLAANAAFLLALTALYALSVRYLTPERALLSLWFLALAPGAAAFTLSYSDSLFLLLAVGVFLAAEGRHPWIAGLALALATLTRAPGLLLALPLLALYIERDGLRPTRAWIPVVLAPLALAGFFAYTWWLTGDPLAPVTAYEYWDGNGPAEALPTAVAAIWPGTVAFYVFLFVFFRHSPIRPAYWLVAALGIAGFLLAGTLVSAPRYIAVAWPFGWALASRNSRIGQAVVLVGLGTAQVVFLWLHFTGRVPP